MTTATKKRAAPAAMRIAAPDLKAALAAVAPAVSHRHPTFCAVRLGGYAAEAYNGDLRIAADLPGASLEPMLLPHERLMAIVGTAAGDVEIARDGTAVVISCGRGQWRLPVIDNEWPERSEDGGKPFLRLPVDQFGRMVSAVIAATDNESSRFALSGVLIEQRRGDVAFVATDGRRLHVAYAAVDQAVDDATAIVPSAAMHTLARLAKSHADEAVQLTLRGAELVADMDGVTVWARLLDGRFPRWGDVIPQEVRQEFGTGEDAVYSPPPPHAEATAGELLAAVRQAEIVTSEQSKGVVFTFAANGLCLTGRSAEYGESTVTAELEVADITASVKLDPVFVRDWLRTVDASAMVEVFAQNAESAVVLRHDDSLAVVMPLAAD